MASCFQATPHSRGTAFRCSISISISISIIAIFSGIAIFFGVGSCGKCCKGFRLRMRLDAGFLYLNMWNMCQRFKVTLLMLNVLKKKFGGKHRQRRLRNKHGCKTVRK